MKRTGMLSIVFMLMCIVTNAQKEFKKSLSGISRIEIETGTSIFLKKGASNEIIIKEGCSNCGNEEEMDQEEFYEPEEDEKAKGLTAIYAGGEDNTGVGIYMEKDGEILRINDLKSFYKRKGLTIIVPNAVAIKMNCGNLGSANIQNITNELEINTTVGYIKLNNVTGPVTAHSSTGNIDAVFTSVNQTAPISISSSTGMIDVSLPSNTKASVELKSTMGSVYSNFNLIEPREDGLKAIGGHKSITGNINNGGVKIALKASIGNIYLRKK
ncbi:DUF4097 family beta strand repeat-containing protein [Zunongwangia pacifica]|uniref:DUF4097 domain-containing protein n=1 Tax=Zunongwangia pacifica TaxID=2911062 RepID=A0A9X2CLS1_9FLAO|nr:DUF4097 family beta strand repeat-containing protein [Zunongwangia pacifica]MCL6220336.1 DUF4097 domain-containing protein [Zunongwangia pacifica]